MAKKKAAPKPEGRGSDKRKKRREKRRQHRLEMLNSRLAEAVAVGAMDADEANDIRKRAGSMSLWAIFELILLIVDMIMKWRESNA